MGIIGDKLGFNAKSQWVKALAALCVARRHSSNEVSRIGESYC
jgi:hypothetical protein